MQLTDHDPDDRLTDAQWNDWRAELQAAYDYYVLNPAHTPAVQFSLWVNPPSVTGEYPVMSHAYGGPITVLSSRHEDVGDPVPLTDDVWDVLGQSVHETMCLTPPVAFEGSQMSRWITERLDRKQEWWLAAKLTRELTTPEPVIQELWPVARWCQAYTGFSIPAYCEGVRGEGDG